MAEATADDVRLMSREERIASYRDLVKGLEDVLSTQDTDDKEHAAEEAEEMAALVEEVETQLRTLATLLNAEESIQPTPGLIKKVTKAPDSETSTITILYPPPPGVTSSSSSVTNITTAGQAAPYEVLFDERDWYPCVITGVVPPENDVDRIQYKAWILGHNAEELVYSESLRPWQTSSAATAEMQGGTRCHVIHPRTGRYVEGVVDRLTLDGTVMVKVPANNKSSFTDAESTNKNNCNIGRSDTDGSPSTAATANLETVSVPLSHIRIGTFYHQLRHRPKNDEERAERRAAQAAVKRQRAVEERQSKEERIAKEANAWQALMGDMLGLDPNAGGKKKRRVR